MSTTASQATPWPELQRAQRYALIAGVAGLVLCAVGIVFDPVQLIVAGTAANPGQFFRSYLVAFNFCMSLALGSLAIWMLHNLTGGRWGVVIRRWLEAATRTLPLLLLFFIPIALGLSYLYIWTEPADPYHSAAWTDAYTPTAVGHMREELEKKEWYLNIPFFLVRAGIYFAVWLVMAYLMNRWSAEQDRAPTPERERLGETFSGPGLVLYGLTLTFASIDWIMSLEPLWNSSIFPAIVATGQLLPAFALAIAGTIWLARRPPLSEATNADLWNDLGSLLMAFIMLWTYMSFSQLLLIWSENLKEEIPWYKARATGGWQLIGILLAACYFALPFIFLLMRAIKRRPHRLVLVAVVLVVMSYVHQFWLVAPAFSKGELALHWMDLAALVGLGGIWTAVFLWQLQARPLLPVHHPLLQEMLHHA